MNLKWLTLWLEAVIFRIQSNHANFTSCVPQIHLFPSPVPLLPIHMSHCWWSQWNSPNSVPLIAINDWICPKLNSGQHDSSHKEQFTPGHRHCSCRAKPRKKQAREKKILFFLPQETCLPNALSSCWTSPCRSKPFPPVTFASLPSTARLKFPLPLPHTVWRPSWRQAADTP